MTVVVLFGAWWEVYRLTMPEIISSSDSAAAIFSAEEGCGRPPNMNDMMRSNRYKSSQISQLRTFDVV